MRRSCSMSSIADGELDQMQRHRRERVRRGSVSLAARTINSAPSSTRSPSANRTRSTVPSARGGDGMLHLHRLDDDQRLAAPHAAAGASSAAGSPAPASAQSAGRPPAARLRAGQAGRARSKASSRLREKPRSRGRNRGSSPADERRRETSEKAPSGRRAPEATIVRSPICSIQSAARAVAMTVRCSAPSRNTKS